MSHDLVESEERVPVLPGVPTYESAGIAAVSETLRTVMGKLIGVGNIRMYVGPHVGRELCYGVKPSSPLAAERMAAASREIEPEAKALAADRESVKIFGRDGSFIAIAMPICSATVSETLLTDCCTTAARGPSHAEVAANCSA